MSETQQFLIHNIARCGECDASIDAKNAVAWAHNHARRTGHAVSLELAYRVMRKQNP
jgi:hypothetical protein